MAQALAINWGELQVTMYRGGPIALILAIIFASFAENNAAAAGVYLLGCAILFLILLAVGRFGPALDAEDGQGCNLPWPIGPLPTSVAPTTTFFWFTMMYFIAAGTGLGKHAGATNDGVIVMTTLFAVYDLWNVRLADLSNGDVDFSIQTLWDGSRSCFSGYAIILAILIGTGVGWLWAFAAISMLKPSSNTPNIACAKESNPKAFRCRVRKEKIVI